MEPSRQETMSIEQSSYGVLRLRY